MKKIIGSFLFLVVFLNLLPTVASALPAILDRRSDEKQRESILKRSDEVLEALYQKQPQAKSAIEEAYG